MSKWNWKLFIRRKILKSKLTSEEFLDNLRKHGAWIGEDVFIGAHSIILKGVTIGARSIVGAGSVVTKDIPADEVWAGNPAKCIRKL